MRRQVLPAIGVFLLLTVVTGLAYPLVVTGLAQLVMPHAANGSLVLGPDGQPVGSTLLGQPFTGDEYLTPRPSAVAYDGTTTGASNAGPTNATFLRDVMQRATVYRQRNGHAADTRVPVDAVTASGSGWDPHISVANAQLQARRIADVRGVRIDDVTDVITAHTTGRTLGFLGEPTVNVLHANLALDGLAPARA